MKRLPILAWVVSAAVVAVVILAFTTIGSPAEERARRFDQQRVMDLQNISSSVDQYYNATSLTLPPSLVALQRPTVYLMTMTDPESGVAYEYRTTGQDTYELCATFKTDSNSNQDFGPKAVPAPIGREPITWSHKAERTCFELKANAWNVKQ